MVFNNPLSPNPSRPAGREGSETAIFGPCTPATRLRPQGRNRCFSPALHSYGRRDDATCLLAHCRRTAPCRWHACTLANTTTAGVPTEAHPPATPPHAHSTLAGADTSNSAVKPPSRPAGREGSRTAIFGPCTPAARLRPLGRNRCFSPALHPHGRRDDAPCLLAHSRRAAACRWHAHSLANTTTAGSPTVAHPPATPPHAHSTVAGANTPNSAVRPPSRPAGREGRGGEWVVPAVKKGPKK
jgi:hypothetical protein